MILFNSDTRHFSILFLGQLISTIGSRMVVFSLSIWVWQETNAVTPLAITLFLTFLPRILFSSFAGVLVDRLPRKLSLAMTDVMAGLSSIVALCLLLTGNLTITHVYLITLWDSSWNVFTSNAFNVTIPDIVPEDKLSKANGLYSGIFNISGIVSPALAGLLYVMIGLQGLLVIDIVTFCFATFTIVVIPIKTAVLRGQNKLKNTVLQDFSFGLNYLLSRRPLLQLLLLSTIFQIIGAIGQTLTVPMILATHDSTIVLGYVVTAFGIGGLVGGIVMGSWKGLENKIIAMILANALISIFGYISMGFGEQLILLYIGAFSITFFIPLLISSEITTWQSRVDRNVLGRVLGFTMTITTLFTALTVLVTGYLTDHIFEPFMKSDSTFSVLISNILGNGDGAGMRLFFLLAGIIGLTLSLLLYYLPLFRNLALRLESMDKK